MRQNLGKSLAVVVALYAVSAQATAAYVAQIKQPTATTRVISAGTVRWQCQGNVCRAGGPAMGRPVDACRALAAQVGAIFSFAHDNRSLSSGELAQCNGGPSAGALVPGRTNSAAQGTVAPAPVPKVIAPPPPRAQTVQTGTLTMTGQRWSPVRLNTAAIAMTGQRSSPVSVNTDTVQMTGVRAVPRQISTDTVAMTGLRWSALNLNTPAISMTGMRPVQPHSNSTIKKELNHANR